MSSSFALGSLLIMLILGGGPRDLLQMMPTDAYWQQKAVAVSIEAMAKELQPAAAAANGDISKLIAELGAAGYEQRMAATRAIAAMGSGVIPELKKAAQSTDPEIATRSERLIEELSAAGKAASVRRLMAIRTLGETKKPEALATLRPLLASKEMFEAEYAARAIATIEGNPFTVPELTRELRTADLHLLPAQCGMMGQVSRSALYGASEGGDFSLDKALAKMSPMLGMERRGPDDGNNDRIRQQVVEGILKVLEQVGNVRLDGATFGLAEDMGGRGRPETGFVAVVLRGQYDHQAMAAAIAKQSRTPDGRKTVDGVEVIKPAPEACLLLPSDDRLIFLAGPRKQVMPVDEVLAVFKTAKPGEDAARNLVAMSKLADTTAPLWLAVRMTDSYRQAPFVNAFDTLGLVGQVVDGNLSLKATATGKDAAAVKTSIEAMRKSVVDGLAEINKQKNTMPPAMAPMIQPVVDIMNSIKLEDSDTQATGSATIKGESTLLMMGMPFFGFRMIAGHEMQHAVPAPAPVQPPAQQQH